MSVLVIRRQGDGHGSGGTQDPDGLGDDDDDVLFDVEELNIEWSEWVPGMEMKDVQAIREAKAGEATVWRMLRGISQLGTRVRTVALSTRGGEPVTRVDMHPEGWQELADRAADGDRYRSLIRLRSPRAQRCDESWIHRDRASEKAQRVYFGGGNKPNVNLVTLVALTVRHALNPEFFDDRLKYNISPVPGSDADLSRYKV